MADLVATTAGKEAIMEELGNRILRVDAELAELDELANAGKTGTLDTAAALRKADYDTHTLGELAEAA